MSKAVLENIFLNLKGICACKKTSEVEVKVGRLRNYIHSKVENMTRELSTKEVSDSVGKPLVMKDPRSEEEMTVFVIRKRKDEPPCIYSSFIVTDKGVTYSIDELINLGCKFYPY